MAVAAPCGAGRSFGVNPASQCAGEQGKTFCLHKDINQVLSVSVPCKGRDNDGVPPCKRAQALWEKPNVVTSAAPDRDRAFTPNLPFRTRFNQKKWEKKQILPNLP